MEALVSYLNSIIWSSALIYLCLGTGLYFSLRTRFLQLRHFRHMIKLMFEGRSSDAGVSSFQALAISLSGRVGTGNIAGVATAIAIGGPGAVFWMWTVAFFGASTAYVEATLAQIYKEKDVYQISYDVFTNNPNAVSITYSNPLSSTYSSTPFTQSISLTRDNEVFKLNIQNLSSINVTCTSTFRGWNRRTLMFNNTVMCASISNC